MTSIGKVIGLEKDKAIISVIRKGSCGDNCAMCNGCSNKQVEVKAFCDIEIKIGDMVEIESDSGLVYLGLFLLFIIPVVFPLCAYLFFLNISFLAAVITATIALLISLSVVFYLSRYKPFLKKITPKVKNVILK